MQGIPPPIVDTAEEIGFGRVERAFRPQYLLLSFLATFYPIALGLLFIVIIVGSDRTIGVVVGVVGVVAALLLLTRGVNELRRAIRRRVYLCKGGLLIADHPTRLVQMIAWEDIAEIRRYHVRFYSDSGIMTLHRCRLRLSEGSTVHLEKPPLMDGQDLGEVVERRSAQVRLPHVLAELEANGRANFGPLTITQDGIHSASNFVGWSDIRLVRLRRVRLRIWGHNGYVSALVRNMSNLMILLMILEQHQPLIDIRFYRNEHGTEEFPP